ncbi:SRPBCC family protein [Tamlana haliotis]|uniref:SRPBCC family protein n=1 Tax=Pseudotamlana haliotis TaxID=2614804 RepID=A0A6N6MIN5_9FLAO|nr:SRPBCC family protein [Tamlana haliotis]KAB1068660.1 SRPBCC family protein [Tamlana haliotis]
MIQFKKHSGIYTLSTEQILNIPLEEAWVFFSNPKNLAKITPSKMGFEITSDVERSAYPGQIISYKIGVLPGIQQNWVTEITQVKNHEFFIDEQRFGPYKMWHHEHFFEALPDGKTLMRDKVSYKLPFGFLGHFIHNMYIKSELQTIFNYRYSTLETRFNGR